MTWLLHKHLTQWPALEATKSPEQRERRRSQQRAPEPSLRGGPRAAAC